MEDLDASIFNVNFSRNTLKMEGARSSEITSHYLPTASMLYPRKRDSKNKDIIMRVGEFLELVKIVIVTHRIRLKACEMLQRTDR